MRCRNSSAEDAIIAVNNQSFVFEHVPLLLWRLFLH
jgi:hypothetical protein